MANNTNIEWCDSTFNPWMGCTKVSPACDHCYAERDTKRFGRVEWGAGKPRVRTSASNWSLPVKWNRTAFYECKECRWRGESKGSSTFCPSCEMQALQPARRRVFCASLADVFDNEVDPQWRADLFDLIRATPNLDWLLLTKRIGNVMKMTPHEWHNTDTAPKNFHLGISVVNQPEADRDIQKLIEAKEFFNLSVIFLSVEPMLGPVELRRNLPSEAMLRWYRPMIGMLDWVICGGESGPNARPMHPDWARSLRDQCAGHGVPFLFKQWGEWQPASLPQKSIFIPAIWMMQDGYTAKSFEEFSKRATTDGMTAMWRVGKKSAGRLLDSVEHNGYPT